jgi:hypothetical protein
MLDFARPNKSPGELFDTVMQESFPALTYLQLGSFGKSVPVLTDTFLGGSAQHLRTLILRSIRFPALPKLLLSCDDLSRLYLVGIPNTGYISPEVMVTGLSALTRLETFTIEFESPISFHNLASRRPPPLTRTILSSLTFLQLRATSEYLEDLVSRIDAPLLRTVRITFFHQLVFDIRQLPWFIGHSPMLTSYSQASMVFDGRLVAIHLYPPEGISLAKKLTLEISCRTVEWQVSSITQICSQFSFLLSSVEQLDILNDADHPTLRVDMDNTQWVELFRPFTAVRILRISPDLRSLVVSALQDLTGGMAAGVLPALHSLHLEEYESSGPEQQAMESFITSRRCSGHLVAVHGWGLE